MTDVREGEDVYIVTGPSNDAWFVVLSCIIGLSFTCGLTLGAFAMAWYLQGR